MLNCNGIVSVTKLEDTQKTIKGVLYFGVKNKDDEWENDFINCVFVGKAVEKAIDIDLQDKEKIEITKGLIRNRQYKDKNNVNKTFLSVTIFEFNYGEEIKPKEVKQEQQQKPARGRTKKN